MSLGHGFKIVRRRGYLSEYSGFGDNEEYVASENPEGKLLLQCFQCKELNCTSSMEGASKTLAYLSR